MLPIQKCSEAGCEIEDSERMPEALKTAVNSLDMVLRNKRQSIVDQINGIITNKPHYASVADAVADMRERTGLNQYLEQIKASEKMTKKMAKLIVAQINGAPKTLEQYSNVNDILSYVDNIISNSHGLGVTIPQLQDDILRTFPKVQPEDIMNDEMSKYLNSKIIEAISLMGPVKENPNLGKGMNQEKFEDEGGNYWAGLEPAK